jgi:hypothetical protein
LPPAGDTRQWSWRRKPSVALRTFRKV